MLSARLKQEISGAQNDRYHNLFGGIPLPEDPLQWLIGSRIEKYEELLIDPDIYACFQKRTLAMIEKEWKVEPAGEGELEQRAARYVDWVLRDVVRFDRLCADLQEALILGYKVAEIIWEERQWKDKNKTYKVVVPADIRPRASQRFTFYRPQNPPSQKTAQLWGYELRFLSFDSPVEGQPLPDKKFLIHSVGSKSSNPLGVGLGSMLYWPHEFKKQAVASALIFGDRFAQPTVVGRYLPEQNPEKLEKFVMSITEGSSAVLPEGMDVFLLEAARSSSQNFYAWFIGWCEDQIKKVVLSETFGDVSQGLSGQPASNDEKVRQELVKSDADLLHAMLNRTLIPWMVEFSFSEAKPPSVWRVFTQEEDLNARVSRDKTLQDMGYKLTPAKFREVYGDGYIDTSESEPSLEEEIGGILGQDPASSQTPQPTEGATDETTTPDETDEQTWDTDAESVAPEG